jgi:hypothetical protein
MPLITVNLTSGIYERIKALVEKGLYTTPEQLLEIAAFNQVALEDGLRPEELVARGHREVGRTEPATSRKRVNEAKGRRAGRASDRQAVRVGRDSRTREGISPVEIADLLGRLTQPNDHDRSPTPSRAALRPPSERLWGQVNRLFPLKFACRWLALANAGREAWERYDLVSERLSSDAAALGSALEEIDDAAGRKRDELLSTGLPRRGNIASQDRFLSQFLARTTRSGEIYPGAICQYALADFDGDRLALTERGYELASVRNPVLDDDIRRAVTTLSDDERSLLTDQVLTYVPGELHDVRLVLAAVLAGRVTPDELLNAVRPELPTHWSDVMTRTHVSGIVARLADMGLLRRRWEGRNVSYEASALATTVLPREKEHGVRQAD